MLTHRSHSGTRARLGALALLAVFLVLPGIALGAGRAVAAPAGGGGGPAGAAPALFPTGGGEPGTTPAHAGKSALQPRFAAARTHRRGQAPATPADPHWTNLFPALNAVSAFSVDDAWAGGDYGHLVHFSYGAWSSIDPPNLRGYSIADISMVTANIGWIAADEHAFAYSGANVWIERSNGLGASLSVNHIVALAANNVWGVGSTSIQPARDTLVHWDGSHWSAAGPVLSAGIGLTGLAMYSPSDGWAVGYDYSSATEHPLLLHYNGSTWTPVAGPPGAAEFDAAAAPLLGDVWITGNDSAYINHIYHYSAGIWTTASVPAGTYPAAIRMLNDSAGWATEDNGVLHWDGTSWTSEYAGVVMSSLSGSAGQVWAVGAADAILSRAGVGPWTPQRGGPTTKSLYSVAPVSPAEAWAVGDKGTVLHYQANVWQAVAVPFTAPLLRVQMLSAADGDAVGTGIIAHWDGTNWAQVATPASALYGLAMLGSQEGWAVGTGGQIWHASGGVWAPASSPVTTTLRSVAMDSPGHGWAVGGEPFAQPPAAALLEYTGGAWVDRSALLPAGTSALQDVLLTDGGSTGWAVVWGLFAGPGPRILRLSHGAWTVSPAPFATILASVAAEALGEAWTMGCSPGHNVGGTWQAVTLPTDSCPWGLGLIPGRGGWAVGYDGAILRYQPLALGQRFYDVPLSNPFAAPIEYMAANNIVSGYADNTFHPYSAITRGQLTKMVVTGLAWPLVAPATNTFADVAANQPFYSFVETAAAHGVVSGYACGGPGAPCDGQHRPYFRPQNAVTRSQLAKIIVLAKGWGPLTPAVPSFADVPLAHPFSGFVERAAAKGIVGGYGCGGLGEPCPGTYFRPTAPATRGQLSKILYLALIQP